MTKNRNTFSTLVAIFPILACYSFKFFPRLDLATIAVVVLFMVNIRRSFFLRWKPIVIAILWTIISSVTGMIIMPNVFSLFGTGVGIIILRLVKFGIVTLIVFAPSGLWDFDIRACLRIVGWVVRLCFFMLILQQLAYLAFNIVIPNPLLYLFSISGGGSMDANYYVVSNGLYRPSAIFLEPAYATEYFTPYLLYVMFDDNKDIKIIDKIVATGAILLTTSALGILVVVAVYTYWIVFYVRGLKKCLCVIPVMMAVVLLSRMGFVRGSVERLMNNRSVVTGRFGNGIKTYERFTEIVKLFGTGYGNVPTGFLNGVDYLLITHGLVGTGIILCLFLYMSFKSYGWRRMILLSCIVLSFGNNTYSVPSLVFYLSLGCASMYSRTCVQCADDRSCSILIK